jgi:hypothetical protein
MEIFHQSVTVPATDEIYFTAVWVTCARACDAAYAVEDTQVESPQDVAPPEVS